MTQKFSSVAVRLIEKYRGKLRARGPHADRHEDTGIGMVTLIKFKSNSTTEEFFFSDAYVAANDLGSRRWQKFHDHGSYVIWRRVPESNRCTRICNPLRHHSANSPQSLI